MTLEDAKSTFLLEHCAERCDGYQNDDTCKNCEINVAIKAIDKQIPKKPVRTSRVTEMLQNRKYKCPVCGMLTLDDMPGYCSCGQKILWEVEK